MLQIIGSFIFIENDCYMYNPHCQSIVVIALGNVLLGVGWIMVGYKDFNIQYRIVCFLSTTLYPLHIIDTMTVSFFLLLYAYHSKGLHFFSPSFFSSSISDFFVNALSIMGRAY